MAINYCTLGSSTVDAFCSPRRGQVITRLINELHPPITSTSGGNVQQVRNTAAIAQLLARQQRPQFDIDDREPMVYEQPFISVTVELFGSTGTQTMDVSGVDVDIVTVTNVDFGSIEPEIVVNISDFTFD